MFLWCTSKNEGGLGDVNPEWINELGWAPQDPLGGSKTATALLLKQHVTKSTVGCIKRQLAGLRGPHRTTRTRWKLAARCLHDRGV